MDSFNSDMLSHPQSLFHLRGHDIDKNGGCDADLGELLQPAGNGFQSLFHHLDSADLAKISAMYSGIKSSNVSVVSSNFQFGGVPNSFGSAETRSSGVAVETGQFMLHKGGTTGSGGGGGGAVGNWHFENWGDSGVVADHSHQTETSTEINDEKYQGILVASGFSDDQSLSVGGSGVAFDTDHTRWLGEHRRLIDDLRSALNSDLGDSELHHLVDAVVSHYDDLFRIKSAATKSDMFHILSGIWRTPAERCLMWLGGFRPSHLLKVLHNQCNENFGREALYVSTCVIFAHNNSLVLEKQIQPLTEQQLVGICNLQQSSQQAEDALSQGMEALHQSLVDTLTLSSTSVAPNAADYMSQMAVAMSKITIIENFLNQADLLRLHTLQQLQRILTAPQAARALLAINDYKSRLRALSSLWLARPKE